MAEESHSREQEMCFIKQTQIIQEKKNLLHATGKVAAQSLHYNFLQNSYFFLPGNCAEIREL